MATPVRRFTPAEDVVIRQVCIREVSLRHARTQLRTTGESIRKRAAEIGLKLPEYFKNTSRMGRPTGIPKPTRHSGGAYDDHALIAGPPISVGEVDLYLAALMKAHVFPRAEQVPCSAVDSRPLQRKPAW